MNWYKSICLAFFLISLNVVSQGASSVNLTDTTLMNSRCKINTEKVWVFILAGQSNMAGRGKIEAEDTISAPRILTINDKGDIIPAKEP